MPTIAILTVKTQYVEGLSSRWKDRFLFCRGKTQIRGVPLGGSGPQKASRNAPKTTLLTRTPWPRNFPEIFPRRACLSDPCFNVQILCISFKIQILCTLFHRHYRIVKHICTNAKNCQEVLRVTARILHNVKGGCGWDWMRVVVFLPSGIAVDPYF